MPKHNECDSYSDAQLLELIAEDTDYLKCVSYRTREYCIKFMQKLCKGVDTDQLHDIYHDALIVLYEKARGGQFSLTCSIQTYLNSVCRNQLLNKFKEEARIASLSHDGEPGIADEQEKYLTTIKDWLPNADEDINNERVQAIAKGLEMIRDKGDCYELLLMVHYQGKSMKDLADHFGYKSEQIARNKNYLCREKLKALAYQLMKKLR